MDTTHTEATLSAEGQRVQPCADVRPLRCRSARPCVSQFLSARHAVEVQRHTFGKVKATA
jgi:hypothetical protein